MPTANDVVCINSNCQLDWNAEVLHLYVVNINDALTVNDGTTLTAAHGIVTTQPSQLVIAEGGQVVNATNNTCCAVQRSIPPYAGGNEGWVSVAWPGRVVDASNNEDLYAYDETIHYWLNEKNEYHDFTAFGPAQGYLYANESAQTLMLGGYYPATNAEISLPVTYTAHELPGLNLIGNPYTMNIPVSNVIINGAAITSYYKATGGSGFVAYTDADEECFKPGDGFMVAVEEEGVLTFTPATRADAPGSYVRLVLSREGQQCDRAYLSMNGHTLGKLRTHEGQSLLYFWQEGESYAIANNPAEARLRFEPSHTATYTIEASLLNAQCEYLHLIDRLMGNDIDLLETSSYTFKASMDDPTDRFSLAFSPDDTGSDPAEGRELDEHFTMPIHQVNDDQNAYYGGNALVVTATANVSQWGSVTGSGTYPRGATCTLTASAQVNGFFYNWTENGKEVSRNPVYSFTVTDDCTLTANFGFAPGAVGGQFSVNSSRQVLFSQGNLQYIGSAATPYWKFADHQWDYLGTSTGQNSDMQNKDRDLFGWGTSGYNHGANYQPWITSQDDGNYYAYGDIYSNLYDETGQADWGYNAISNGGNQENIGWRTLTHEEWEYLFNTRNTPSGIRYAKANVNNVNGVILLPDDWNTDYYSLGNTNSKGASYSSNVITVEQWAMLEQHGAVFLPAAGMRYGTSVDYAGSNGIYWSSSSGNGTGYSWYVSFNDSQLTIQYNYGYRSYGQSVRLVSPSPQYNSFGITATPSPAEAGAVSGGGVYPMGADCTLTATANPGYVFVNWTKYGMVVSNNASLTFTVDENADYVANFVEEGDAITQTTALTQGWNWYSTYVEQNGIEGLEQMETSLGDNGLIIKSHSNGFVSNFGSFWAGSLTSVNNTSTYLIETNAACEMTVTGPATTPSAHPITLPTGWRWIGYPCTSPMSGTKRVPFTTLRLSVCTDPNENAPVPKT